MMDSRRITITLPYAVLVSDNRRAGVLGARVILTRRYREAKETAHLLAVAQMGTRRLAPMPGPCAMVCELYPPDKRRRDALGPAKLLNDALQGACYDDDAQLVDVRYIRHAPDAANPRVEIEITAVP